MKINEGRSRKVPGNGPRGVQGPSVSGEDGAGDQVFRRAAVGAGGQSLGERVVAQDEAVRAGEGRAFVAGVADAVFVLPQRRLADQAGGGGLAVAAGALAVGRGVGQSGATW